MKERGLMLQEHMNGLLLAAGLRGYHPSTDAPLHRLIYLGMLNAEGPSQELHLVVTSLRLQKKKNVELRRSHLRVKGFLNSNKKKALFRAVPLVLLLH